jgi:hypothetical protein
MARNRFSELDSIKICMKYKKMKNSTMQAQPKINFIKSKKNRTYYIFVNKSYTRNGISYIDLTFNSLIGWYGHEISHIIDYRNRSNIGLVIYGLKYVTSKKFKRNIEFQTDSFNIAHGLGCQLLEGVEFCLTSNKITCSYKEKRKKFYLSPEQIIEQIDRNRVLKY